MQTSNLTPRQYWEEVKSNPNRARFGFGEKAALINIDLQRAYTDIDSFPTAYQTNPDQIDYVNRLSALARDKNMPVIWTYVAYMGNADDAGVWGTRTDTENSLQNIKEGDARAELDPRLIVDRERDAVINKRMASVFHDSLIPSLLVWHKVDTVILTGGSTSGCVRASSVSSLSHGYRTIVPEECVADKHEIPHFANLCDIMLKYADVEPFAAVADWLENHPGCAPIRRARGVSF
ncbi:MAG: isochorismatase family protein [Gammaproteobacteria bacterium]|nr:isochorismatase family protein [Gammaproteobacteria bacterium]MDE0414691.1 isochorismatase family protein [Gammaproteobacteria bacterium]